MTDAQAKILIVDDEPNIVTALEFLLEREGYRIKKAYNGMEALAVARQFHPDIVLLDVMMPEMDGFEAARRIRQLPSLENAKIIFLTAKGTQSDRQTGYNNGAEYYIVKPFDNAELVGVVNEVLVYG